MAEDRSVSAATYSAEAHAMMGQRTAAHDADFFLPHLHPGMRLLDSGCGIGSITIGLANAVAPGQVVGLDRDAEQVDRARALAAERGVANVRFEVGDVYTLPFPDASFDAVFAHQLLPWLREPVAALNEFRRVLTDNGVAGVRTIDPTFCVMDPVIPPLD
jgi:ubiquinone/menaquinone biosynthesis C-methylase UbiE